jgi:hypothetical protein
VSKENRKRLRTLKKIVWGSKGNGEVRGHKVADNVG